MSKSSGCPGPSTKPSILSHAVLSQFPIHNPQKIQQERGREKDNIERSCVCIHIIITKPNLNQHPHQNLCHSPITGDGRHDKRTVTKRMVDELIVTVSKSLMVFSIPRRGIARNASKVPSYERIFSFRLQELDLCFFFFPRRLLPLVFKKMKPSAGSSSTARRERGETIRTCLEIRSGNISSSASRKTRNLPVQFRIARFRAPPTPHIFVDGVCEICIRILCSVPVAEKKKREKSSQGMAHRYPSLYFVRLLLLPIHSLLMGLWIYPYPSLSITTSNSSKTSLTLTSVDPSSWIHTTVLSFG